MCAYTQVEEDLTIHTRCTEKYEKYNLVQIAGRSWNVRIQERSVEMSHK